MNDRRASQHQSATDHDMRCVAGQGVEMNLPMMKFDDETVTIEQEMVSPLSDCAIAAVSAGNVRGIMTIDDSIVVVSRSSWLLDQRTLVTVFPLTRALSGRRVGISY